MSDMRTQELMDTYSDLVHDARGLPKPEWRAALTRLISQLELAWKTVPSSDLAYAIGYCYFHLPGHDHPNFAQAQQWLQRSIGMAPDHYYGHYYLAMLYFEFRRFDDCASLLVQIPDNWFQERGQQWRDYKRQEVMLCCRLHTRPDTVTEQDIHEVMTIHHDQTEVWPLPEELVATVVELARNQPTAALSGNVVQPLIKDLMECNLDDVFKVELQTLRQGARMSLGS